jgi:DinB superfamily
MASLDIFAQLESDWRELQSRVAPAARSAQEAVMSDVNAPSLRPVVLFAELEDVWLDLRDSPGLEQDAGHLITSQWRLRDLLAHLASWAREFRYQAKTAAAGAAFDYQIEFAPGVGPTAWNHAQVDQRRAQTLEEIFAEFNAETRRLQDLVMELSAEALNAKSIFPVVLSGATPAPMLHSIAEVAVAKCRHDHYHLGRIAAWREGSRRA